RDISKGRELRPIMVINHVDDEVLPNDFIYISGYVETSPINVNKLVTSLKHCKCSDNCTSSSACSCSRASCKRWYDNSGRLTEDFNYLDPPLIYECNILCICDSSCHNRVIQSGTINYLQVFRTNGRGWGCRTLKNISKGTFVCEYAGELITDEEANRREDDSYLFDLDTQDEETYCIDASKFGNVSRFINHLCEPNVKPVKVFVDHHDLRFPRICFFASKDIKAFDELGFDYGYKFWSIKWKQFTCTCGSRNCKYSTDTILQTIEEYSNASPSSASLSQNVLDDVRDH
ncbi:hypothetical protein HELRODRAFT_82032, partial [Helobdella robusta]|uniref:SET domain-containing protein n=1 Tax=Helobdella robusta TaxID=6412 RepID=T1G4M1_HELRO